MIKPGLLDCHDRVVVALPTNSSVSEAAWLASPWRSFFRALPLTVTDHCSPASFTYPSYLFQVGHGDR
jgi:hypothetical protein